MEHRDKAETKKDEPEPETRGLNVRAGVRAGYQKIEGAWKLGNKVWSDDWLAPV